MAALDLAEELGVPVEWFALSSGARIAMDSGTENMDWVAAALRRIIEFTQHGGEINVVVTGINVGAQPYWNAEATMLMHTRGILVMAPESAMVLTGKQALDFAGGVSAEDNFGIGGYDRIMGPNGQAQYWAPDLAGACARAAPLLRRTPTWRRASASRAAPRRATRSSATCASAPHSAPGSELRTVGDIFSDETNPGRKQAFDIRSRDARGRRLRPRAAGALGADARRRGRRGLGRAPRRLADDRDRDRVAPDRPLRPDARRRAVAVDVRARCSRRASKKVARAINSNGGRRPLVVLANLAGFDGSPESMRQWQLEYGAEIGRAIVNFRGPIVFCVISRYHGGAFVVFSQRLNEGFEAIAVEGAHASVIGGSAAAGVVFTRDVNAATRSDRARRGARGAHRGAPTAPRRGACAASSRRCWRPCGRRRWASSPAKFDSIHSIQRAVEVGSVSSIVAAAELRPYLVDAIERGMKRTADAETRGAQRFSLATSANRLRKSSWQAGHPTRCARMPGKRSSAGAPASVSST